MPKRLRIVALLATYNEERFITACLEHLTAQGVAVYLIDNESTDRTVELAERFRGRGLIGLGTLARPGYFSLRPQLEQKETLATTLDGDWFIHLDADEFRLPPRGFATLRDAVEDADARGFNAINFTEFTFVPVKHAPDHDHPRFQETMRWYYPYAPFLPHRLNAWKQPRTRVELAHLGGHQVRFPGVKMYPLSFSMRHYLFLSARHAVEKFVSRGYDPLEVRQGWSNWRSQLRPDWIEFPDAAELREFAGDSSLDFSNPRTRHWLADVVLARALKEKVVP
jgi:glycosyltransferase involved in cell wall biosynthesis